MPNGGVMPSCAVCKFGERLSSEEFSNQPTNRLKIFMKTLYRVIVKSRLLPHDVGENQKVSITTTCNFHNFTVWGPLNHFCAHLQGSDENGLSRFVKENHLESGLIYAWFEFPYRDPEYPDIPQYHHELRSLVEVKEYEQLSLDAKKRFTMTRNGRYGKR
jgi:hypothetical protein